jgi:hypothetical protein
MQPVIRFAPKPPGKVSVVWQMLSEKSMAFQQTINFSKLKVICAIEEVRSK